MRASLTAHGAGVADVQALAATDTVQRNVQHLQLRQHVPGPASLSTFVPSFVFWAAPSTQQTWCSPH